jgi:hypothetical protein
LLLLAAILVCSALPAGAVGVQQVTQRLRAAFARAETAFRTSEPSLAVPSLDEVIDTLLPDAEIGRLDPEARALLARSLAYRADARLFEGDRDGADEDLTQLLTLFPRIVVDGFGLSDGALERFARAQGRMLGALTFSPVPFNARLRVDGEELPPDTTSYTVLAGTHYVEGYLPGFTRYADEVDVRADRSAEVSFLLERVSAVIKLMTHPAGAQVVIDGNPVGMTSGQAPADWTPTPDLSSYPRNEFSDVMEIEGLMPGQHEVEILLDGYRTFSAPITIPDLADFQVGTVVLEPNVGLVLLRDLPSGAEVWVDGRRTRPEPPSRGDDTVASNAYRLSLQPGQYRITVSDADAGVFEESVTVADRRNQTLTVRLRPGLTFLGVTGDDRLGAQSLEESLRTAFGNVDFWTFLDRSEEAQRVLERVGVTANRLRDAAVEGADPGRALDWQRLQAIASRELPGSMFVLGVLEEEELAASADLWIWPAAPGPAVAERVSVSLAEPGAFDSLARRLSEAVRLTRPWSGLELIDSLISPAPIVAEVAPGGPAEAAGVQPGESVLSVGGNDVATVATADEWFATFAPGASVALELSGPSGDRVVEVRMGSTPVVVGPNDPGRLYTLVWGMTAAAVGRMDADVPSWLAELNQAAVLLHAREWDAAADLLRSVQAPDDGGLGQALAYYWLGVALAEAGDTDGARSAFEEVLRRPDARYLSNDGPYLVPMARARLAALDAAAAR